MPYSMGMDGGGSKTVTVITEETGRLLGRGIAGRGKHQISGIDAVKACSFFRCEAVC